MSTHYESLHVTEDAPDEVIRASYRALSLKHHPDTAGDRPQSRWKMQRINDAYDVLSDSTKRAAYDLDLRHARQPAPATVASAIPSPASMPLVRSRRERHLQRMLPHIGTRGLLGWLCDARVVLPVIALIWLVIYWVLASRRDA
jgi:curved DNA-binding protein CbpA